MDTHCTDNSASTQPLQTVAAQEFQLSYKPASGTTTTPEGTYRIVQGVGHSENGKFLAGEQTKRPASALEQFLAAIGEPLDRPVSIVTGNRQHHRGNLVTGFWPELDTRPIDAAHPYRRPDLAQLRSDASPWVAAPEVSPRALVALLKGSEGGVTFRPNRVHHENETWEGSKVLFAEWDDLPLEDQEQRIADLKTRGLGPTAIVFSGSKSLHCYWALEELVTDSELWKTLMAWIAVALGSDPAIVTLHREMRLPGAYRLKDGEWRQQKLVGTVPENRYSIARITEVLQSLCPLPYGMTEERFKDWKRAKAGQQRPDYDGPTPQDILTRDYDEWHRQQQEDRDRRAIERAARREQMTATGATDFADLVSQAEDRLGWDAFLPYLSDYDEPHGGKARCLPMFRTGSGSKSAFVSEHQGKLLYHDPNSGEKAIGGFRFWLYVTRGFGYSPTGKDFIDAAKEFCALAGVNVPELETRGKSNRAKLEKRLGLPKLPPQSLQDDALEFEPGDRAKVYAKLREQGFKYVLDRSTTGSGKSHSAGELTPEGLGVAQLFYVDDQHRNPTAPTLKDWTDLPARHQGLISEQKPDGSTVLRRVKAGETPEVKENCIRIDTLNALRAANVSGADTAKILCQGCTARAGCMGHIEDWRGPDYISARRTAMAKPRIRAHIDSLPAPGDFSYENIGLIINEDPIQTSKTLGVDLNDVARAIADLSDWTELHPTLKALYDLMQTEKLPRYGLPHSEIVKVVPACAVDPNDIDAATDPDLSFLEPNLIPGSEDTETRTEKQVSEGYAIAKKKGYQGELHDFEQVYQQWHRGDISKRLQIEMQVFSLYGLQPTEGGFAGDKGKTSRNIINRAIKYYTARKSEGLANNIAKQWVGDLLRVLNGDYPGATLTLTYDGLQMCIPDPSHRAKLKAAAFVVVQDATRTQADLAQKLGCSPEEIAVVQEKHPPISNLKRLQITDMGAVTRQRGKDQERRIAALLAAVKEQDPTAAAIDFKGKDADGSWWVDNRASNAFMGCDTLIAIGTPYENLGAALARYCCERGEIVTLEDESFRLWYARLVMAELHQLEGRLRAIRRTEQLTIILISDFPLEGWEQIKAEDITPEAAPKSQRLWQKMKDAAVALAQDGVKVTQEAIAAALGITQGRVSQLVQDFQGSWADFKKLLILLLDPYSEINNPTPDPDPDTTQTFTNVITVAQQRELIPLFGDILVTNGWDMVLNTLAQLPQHIRQRVGLDTISL